MFSSLSGMDWLFFILLFVFLNLSLNTVVENRTKKIFERLETIRLLGEKTPEERKKADPIYKKIYAMLEARTVQFLEKRMKKSLFVNLEQKLTQAGLTTTPVEHWAKRILFGVGMFAVGILTLKTNVNGVIIFTILGFYYPDFKLREKIKKRHIRLKNSLPDFLDLLSAAFTGTSVFEEAIKKVCDRYDSEISREFAIALGQINTGLNRRSALQQLAKRCDIDEIKTLINFINQSDKKGVGLRNTIKVQADRMRIIKKQMAEMKAKRASVTLYLPGMFLLLTALIMIAGPSVVQFMSAMKGL